MPKISFGPEEQEMTTLKFIEARAEHYKKSAASSESGRVKDTNAAIVRELELVGSHLFLTSRVKDTWEDACEPESTNAVVNSFVPVGPQTRMEAIHFLDVLTHAKHALGDSTIDRTLLAMAELITNDFNQEYRSSMKIEPMV